MKVKIVLRNPLNKTDKIDYNIEVFDNVLAKDWIVALKKLLTDGNLLEKNYCFLGFPKTARDLNYLSTDLTKHVNTINNFFTDYRIDEVYTPETLTYPGPGEFHPDVIYQHPNHDTLNKLHNHFERLQGTVWNLSEYYKKADYETKYAIRQLNNICHEMENYILGQRKVLTAHEWIRPSQITTFLNSKRYDLTEEHRKLFVENSYDRVLGGVYMHWTQIGKTLFEVFRDEGAPKLNVGKDPGDITVDAGTTCEAITALRYYSGEFDVEWGNNVTYGSEQPWHDKQQDEFKSWLITNNLNPEDPSLSLGYLPIGQITLQESFGTINYAKIWEILGTHLDIYSIEIDGVSNTFDYCWSDDNYKQMQIDMMRPGYDYSSRR